MKNFFALKPLRLFIYQGVVLCSIAISVVAQIPPPAPAKYFGEDKLRLSCGTKPRSAPKIIPKSAEARQATVLPYCIKVYITVFSNNSGDSLAASSTNVMRQFNAMVSQLAQHSICFVLLGIREVRNSDLNIQTPSEESELNPYRISGAFNIFVHFRVQRDDGQTLGGTAYDIPNTGAYVSLSGPGNVSNANDIVTMSHEVGHALGLYHTFEPHPWDPFHGKESATRLLGNSCFDCDVDGDLICDTPADPDQDNDDNVTGSYLAANTNGSCVYTGNRTDECSQPYVPATDNAMSYGRTTCLNTFTVGQGSRMRYFLANESAFQNILSAETLQIPIVGLPLIFSSGASWQVARDQVTLGGTGTVYQVIQGAYQQVQSKRIVLKSGVRLAPNATGGVHIAINPYCQ